MTADMRCAGVAALVLLIGLVAPATAAAGQDILSDAEVLELTLAAPLDELFAHVEDEDYNVVGRLTYTDAVAGREVTLDGVRVSLRGYTSRRTSECEFPKLKLEFAQVAREGTAIAALDALKLGTHCAERSDDDLTPRFGRLANERATHREALVYQMLHAAGVPTLRVRPARLTYVHSDGSRPPLVRNALLLEDDSDAMRRLGATGAIKEAEFTTASQRFEPADAAKLALAQGLVGNFDWCLRFFPGDIYRCNDRHPLWNVLAFIRREGPALPVMYDFDLAGPVVGRHIWFRQVFDTAFSGSGSAVDVEVLAQVHRTRSLFGRDVLDAARRSFVERRAAIYGAIESSTADPVGRELARQYADSFFGTIQDDHRFYAPVIVEGGHEAFTDAGRTNPACGRNSLVPSGTPVSEPIERREGMVRVRLLDALWEWTGARRCDVVHREPVWIPEAAVGSAYPQ